MSLSTAAERSSVGRARRDVGSHESAPQATPPRDGRAAAFAPWTSMLVASRSGAGRSAHAVPDQTLGTQPPPAAGATVSRGAAPTRGSRILTGLTMALMGSLLWLASQGQVWARDLVVVAGPLLILAAGILATIIVTDRNDIMGKSGIIAGVAILFMARFGIVPEATVLILGPWGLIVMGAVVALSGLGLRAQPVGEGAATRKDAGPPDTTREHEHCLNLPVGNGTSGRQRAKAS